METLFELVKLYATNIRARKADGEQSWKNLKEILTPYAHKCEWNLKFLIQDYQTTYDHFYTKLGMDGDDGDKPKYVSANDTETWEKKHFYLQLIRLPLLNPDCNLIRLCQIAYNIGQLKAVFDLPENEHIYTETVKRYFHENKLDNINTYTNLNLDCYKVDYSKLIKSIKSLLTNVISHSKYLKYDDAESNFLDQVFYKKYLKYKSKYLALKYQLGGVLTENEQKSYNLALKKIKSKNIHNSNLFTQPINNDYDEIDVIAFKSSDIINKDKPGYLGNIGININNNKIIGAACKDHQFNINNPTYCYFFVTFYEEFIKLSKERNVNTELRLKELLGLKEEWGPYTHVVLMNIRKRDLFRPCYDKPDISKNICKENPEKIDSEYNKWLDAFKKNSEKQNIPFTGLGYTMDWIGTKENKHIGATEMIILPGSSVNIKYIFTFEEFMNKRKN